MIESKAWNWEGIDSPGWRTVAEEFLPTAQRWKSVGRTKALDLGCGIGRNALYMARIGMNVYAFDLSDSGLARLAAEAEAEDLSIKIQKGDMLSLPYEDGFFDCVLAFHAIYHTDYKGLSKVLSEIHRVLTPGGEAYVTFNSKENEAWAMLKDKRVDEFTVMKVEAGDAEIPHTYLSYEEVIEILPSFTVLKIQQIFDYFDAKKHAHFLVKIRKTSD